jgi:flavin-dependent dehydrogenase
MSAGRSRLLGVRVASAAGDRELRARVVIAADGRHSRVAFTLGLAHYAPRPRRWAFGAYYAGVDGTSASGEMHIRQGGYIGLAPVPGGLTNVCVVRELGTAFRAQRIEPESLVHTTVTADPLLGPRFARAERAGPVTVLGPLAVESTGAGVPGLLLAGDAAGFIDPMTGDGLRFAIRGAELAAAAALREVETGHAMHDWLASRRRREFSGKWRMNRALRALVASPRAIDLAGAVAARWQLPVRMLISLAGDVHLARQVPPAA